VIDNPVLADRQMGWETDTRRVKLGDGVTAWNDLPYAAGTASDVDTVAGVPPDGGGDVPEATLKTALDLPANTVTELSGLQTQIDAIEASDVETVAGVAPTAGDVLAASLKTALNLPTNTVTDLSTRGRFVATDASFGLAAPSGVGGEFVITADVLDDIRYDGVSL
jgi:hypothetical protein